VSECWGRWEGGGGTTDRKCMRTVYRADKKSERGLLSRTSYDRYERILFFSYDVRTARDDGHEPVVKRRVWRDGEHGRLLPRRLFADSSHAMETDRHEHKPDDHVYRALDTAKMQSKSPTPRTYYIYIHIIIIYRTYLRGTPRLWSPRTSFRQTNFHRIVSGPYHFTSHIRGIHELFSSRRRTKTNRRPRLENVRKARGCMYICKRVNTPETISCPFTYPYIFIYIYDVLKA